jgi:hypothetical protein
MGAQQSEASLVAKVKQILESVTGTKYILKTKSELVHPDGISWYLHLPLEHPEGWISHAYQEGKEIVFESPSVYDVANVIEFEYRESMSRKDLREDIARFQVGGVRRRYVKQVPKVVRFFDSVEGLVSDANERYPRSFSIINDRGLVSIVGKSTVSEASKDEFAVSAKLGAMRELLRQVEKASK